MLLNLNKSKSKLQKEPQLFNQIRGANDIQGYIQDSDTDRTSVEFNDRSDAEQNQRSNQEHQPVILTTFQELFKVFNAKLEDGQYFKHKGKSYQLSKESIEFMGLRAVENQQLGQTTDQNFFQNRKQKRSSSNVNRDTFQSPSPYQGMPIQQQFSNQYSMFPIIPGMMHMGGSYYQPSHPFQQNSELQYRLYQQQSLQQYPVPRVISDFSASHNQNRLANQQLVQTVQDVHLAYLFASPLVLETSESNYHDMLDPIGFKEEFEQILMKLETQQLAFRYRYMVANDSNLRECLNDNPLGLHFVGHGFQNIDVASFMMDKKGWIQNRGKGDMLIFEKEDGSSSYYTETDLKKLLLETYSHQKLEFVVVASCHSEQVGKIFQNCGAKHVICIDQKTILQDEAAIEFSKTFYNNLFGSSHSICKAFISARDHIAKQISKLESEKYKLLISDEHPPNKCKMNDIRRRLVPGQVQYKGVTPKILKLPTKVTPFISRNMDMFDVVKTLSECNIVQVFGMPGLGKSSLLKNVSNYIGERNFYRDGLLYINFQTIKTFQEALALIMQNFEDNTDPYYKMNKIDFQFNQSFRKQEKSRLLKQIYKKFQRFKKGLLLVLDNIDDIAVDYQNDIVNLLTNIVQDSTNSIKILFSSSVFFEQLENYKVKKLRGLSQQHSVELFLTKIPLQNEDLNQFLSWERIVELHKFTVEKFGEGNVKVALCKIRNHTRKCVVEYLVQHPLFNLLGGQPLSISLIAPLSLKFSLKEIYQQLVELPIINVFKGKIKEDALILSLEFSIKILNDSYEKAVELFYLIGITKEGLFEDDLDQLFEDDDTQKKLQSLIELSLIQFETFDKAGKVKRFKVTPFIDKYVEQKLEQKSKRDLHIFLAIYYTNKLRSLKKEFSKNQDQKLLSQQLSKYEQNIVYCMKELFNMDYKRNTLLTPSKQSQSQRNSPVRQRNPQKLVDKNMLDIGNATLKMKDSSGKTRIVTTKAKKHHGHTPTLQFGTLGEEEKIDKNFEEAFERRKLSVNQFSANNLRASDKSPYQEFRERDGYYQSAQNESSSDYVTDNNQRVRNHTPMRDFKIRQSSNMRYQDQKKDQEQKIQTIQQDSRSTRKQRNFPESLEIKFTSNRVIKNFKNSDTNLDTLNLLPKQQQQSNISDNDSENSAASQNKGDENKFRVGEKKLYMRQLNKLQQLDKQQISKNRFDQLVKSLTLRLGKTQKDDFELIKRGGLNFQDPLEEQLSQLKEYEHLCFHYVSILTLLDHRCQEVPKIIYSNENCSAAQDKNELIIPMNNKLLQANLKMAYIYYLLCENKYDAVNGENLELYSLFQDINCPLGEGISLYLKAKYLQKMKRKNAYQKAEKYVLKSAAKFEQCQDLDGLYQCVKLLEKIKKDHPQIVQLGKKMIEIKAQMKEENKEIQDERLELDRKAQRDQSEDKVRNLLLNVIEYSFLKKKITNPNDNGGISSVQEQKIGNNYTGTQSLEIKIGNFRGPSATPKILTKSKISNFNQPRTAFKGDQDEEAI
ncbi:nb-arc domain protein [Stylonychia lemnae]|uniref:Nb-arc domain protein n=1 Tax=Stylonychia lemnae TaxID=5949 RepID=A0A078AEI4_STYLE|nr:nb-arc domain protein [Stylonychia lemnae]|eukprot:CDW80630.1 nb-arc domain protein [Stylonychia lemnae]